MDRPFWRVRSRAVLALLAVAAQAGLGACGNSAPDQSHLPPDRRVETRISPALDVELSAMEARPSGLYIQDLVVGEGIRADSGDVATVHYAGWLPSGVEFDARREGPGLEVALGYGRVIAGWDQGVVGMRVGGRRKLVVPPGLAYGAEGRGRIPGNSTLVFEVELLEVEDRTPGGDGAAGAPDQAPGSAAPGPGTPDPPGAAGLALALEGEGLRVFEATSGSARPIPFGSPTEDVMRIIEGVREASPRERGESPDCAGTFATWEGGPSVRFSDGRFVGWSVGQPGPTTPSGVGVGSTRNELEDVHAIEVSRTSLGVEFSAGALAGVLDGDGADARITALWAGEACLAR